MAIYIIPKRFQRLWDRWNIRSVVLVSLCLQIILIFLSPLRKRTGRYSVIIIVWSAYFMADWVAAYALGLISSSQSSDCEKSSVNDAVAAFWAPFLLLHLGGPDNITAFSLEDNELWIRHLLGLLVQLLMVAYVFSLAIPNAFWLPTVLVFLAGTIKYAERTRAFYLACLENFKDSMRVEADAGRNSVRLLEEYSAMKEAGVPAELIFANEPQRIMPSTPADEESLTPADEESLTIQLSEVDIIPCGYRFYKIFRGLIVDHMFSFSERSESRAFFFRLKPEDAFKVMEVELNFMYDELFTKMATVHRGYFGYFSRFACTVLIVVAFLLFHSHKKVPKIHIFDIAVTYALLIGAIILDFLAVIKVIFCDWTIASVRYSKALGVIYPIHKRISLRHRWSERLSGHNLISYCLKKRFKWLDPIIDYFGLKNIFEEILFKYHRDMKEGLQKIIFSELREKAKKAPKVQDAKDICSSRGEQVIKEYGISSGSVVLSVSKDTEYDESLLLWHIATDLLYHTLNNSDSDDQSKSSPRASFNPLKSFARFFCVKNPDQELDNREICKILSDYMLYLLVMRPNLMSAVGGISQIRFQDTCAEAMKLFPTGASPWGEREARKKLLEVNTEVKPISVKGDRSKLVLFDAFNLAKELKSISDRKKMWKMMSKVWLELLCFGASHCRGNAHAQQLSKGGELITFVWLLMAHFGLGDQFKIEPWYARAKLIVDWQPEENRLE